MQDKRIFFSMKNRSFRVKVISGHLGFQYLENLNDPNIVFYFFNHLSSHPKKVRCQSTPFCGFNTQWFSSG